MSKAKLHFQLSFTKSSESIIKNLYKLSPNDEILMAVWFSDTTYSIFERHGFVITKEGFGWNYLTMAESTEKGELTKERVSRNFDFLSKKKVRFLGTDVRDTETAARADGKREIQLRTSDTLFIYGFDSSISQEKVVLLERAIASNFADAFDSSNFEKDDDSYSLPLTLITIRDYFINISSKIKNKFYDLKEATRKRNDEKSNVKETAEKTGEAKDIAVKTVNKVGAFFRHIIDFFTDVMLMFAVLIFVKPQLLMENFLQGITTKISGLTFSFFYYDWDKTFPTEVIEKRNFIFIVLAGLYLVLKIFISLSCRKNRKAVTALLFIMLIADFFLVKEKFLIFTILLLLILLALQFSMGFSANVVRLKVLFFTCVCIIGYIVLHIVLYADFTELLRSLISLLRLPVKWW